MWLQFDWKGKTRGGTDSERGGGRVKIPKKGGDMEHVRRMELTPSDLQWEKSNNVELLKKSSVSKKGKKSGPK